MKKYFFLFIILFVVLASCKSGQTAEDKLAEKKSCFKECMLLEDDKEFCLDDCGVEEKDVEEKEVCGDNVCHPKEKENSLCPADCGCSENTECGDKEICKYFSCTSVECTLNSHCSEGYTCSSNVCVVKNVLDEDAVTELQDNIEALQEEIQTLLDNIDELQTALDAANATDEDKDAIQDDIDALDATITQLGTYDATLSGYLDDLSAVTKNSEVADVGTAFDATKENVDAYISLWQQEVDDINDAIDALQPAEQPDLIVDDLDLEDVDGNDATFTVTIKNDADGNITTAQTFRIQLTSYELDNDTNDEARETITTGLEPDDEVDIEMSVELPYDLEDYFTDNPNATSLVLKFLVGVDIDGSISETDETNNNQTFNVTFSRDNYVSNLAPNAYITVNASSVLVNESILFNASTSTDSDGTISSYSWNFGDSSTSTGATATHSYAAAGTYTATLTVTDNDSATDTETVTITVT